MSLVHDLVPCRQCRLTFASESGLRRHELLDHTPAPDGAVLTALLVAAPERSAEPAGARGERPDGARCLLPGAACVALALASWLLLLALFVATRA